MAAKSVAFLDFEASSFNGYPIEVGFARLWRNGRTRRGSRLIYHSLWDRQMHLWDSMAEEVHGVSRAQLREHGFSPTEVMKWLNQEMVGLTEVYCDGGHWDERWMRMLVFEAGAAPSFVLKDIAVAFSDPSINDERFHQAERVFMDMPMPHGAEEDAWRLANLFLLAAGWDERVA